MAATHTHHQVFLPRLSIKEALLHYPHNNHLFLQEDNSGVL
jgi:hypothetical protein